MKRLFIGQWSGVLPHHPTQMGEVIGAEFFPVGLLDSKFNQSIAITKYMVETEVIFWCTRMVSDYSEVKDFVQFAQETQAMSRPTPKLVLFDLEGLTYFSLSNLGKLSHEKTLEYFATALAHADLVITGSESSAQVYKALVPEANVEVFGFIPEETGFYDQCLNTLIVHDKKEDDIWIGLGSKGGVSRGGLFDFLAASKIRNLFDGNVSLFPLTNGAAIHDYLVLSHGLTMKVVNSHALPYQSFLTQLSLLDVVINLDPLDGASRLASECARVKTPCIGMRHSMYQEKYFDDISVDTNDIEEVAAIAYGLLKTGKNHPSVIKAYNLAKEDDRDAHISQWKQLLKGIGVEV